MDDKVTQARADRTPLQLALALARAGVSVAPALLAPLDDPTVATTDKDTIRAIWARWPDALVAVELPGIGLFTLDSHAEGALLPHGGSTPYGDGTGQLHFHPDKAVQRADRAWFIAHPFANEYLRAPLPGEFDRRLGPPEPGHCWMVRVTAFRDPVRRLVVLLRLRTAEQVRAP